MHIIMKTFLLFISISCLSPVVSAQMVSLSGEADISRWDRHLDPESEDNLAIRTGGLLSTECSTDLQVYLDLNKVCDKLALAGPRNVILIKGGVMQVGFKAGCLFRKPFRGWNRWAGRDRQHHIQVVGKMDVSLVSTITHHLNSCKSMMMAGMTPYPH